MTFRIVMTTIIINGQAKTVGIPQTICELCDEPILDHLEKVEIPFYMDDDKEPFEIKTLCKKCEASFEPSGIGTAYVTFEGIGKEYTYPAFFWGD